MTFIEFFKMMTFIEFDVGKNFIWANINRIIFFYNNGLMDSLSYNEPNSLVINFELGFVSF